MPPLDTSKITLERLVGDARDSLKLAVCGLASLLLRYKGQEGAVLSLDEAEDGARWIITQVQGARSRKSYRLTLGMRWQDALSADVGSLSCSPLAEVQQIAMPRLFDVEGMDAVIRWKFGGTEASYMRVRNTLGLRFSEEDNMYVADVQRLNS